LVFWPMRWWLASTLSMTSTRWWSTKRFSPTKLSSQETSTSNYSALTCSRNAKSLVKHLLEPDVTLRYGELKEGVNQIKNHRWFKQMDWHKLSQKKLPVPYLPQIG
jgi:hypothetical protein